MIIDMEHHLATYDRLEKGKSESGKCCERYWDTDGKMKIKSFEETGYAESHLEFMDETGIDIAVLTTNPITSLDQCRRWNDFCTGLVNDHPDRFIGFATVPPLGGEDAFAELDRAVGELGLKGVHIWTWNDGQPLDSREMWPFYEKAAELGIPVDVHVTLEPPGLDSLHAEYALYYVMARELDMVSATLRVCLGGVLEDFPELKLIMNHFGGGVSAVMERLDAYMGYVGPGCPSLYTGKPLITRPWREYFDKLYFNMAGREAGMAAVKSALTTISPQKLMFGTDWPFNYDHNAAGAVRYIEEIRKLDLSEKDIDDMLGGNAARLLGIR
ncbi:MAG: amidohydrolase [Dehalococcoidales bacterium]|nr:amidohydrolase [Dehalococcoidales bacterium]